jgi:hypothetical protein
MAAGLGFKDFVTGEVLTAADVDGYLMQGIWVFASNAARDAAVTAPAEGNFAFTKDTNSLWYYDGAAWVASGATGDIEGVTAGTGISGGGTSGTVTITNSMATAIDAKGDLIVGTGADTFSKLTAGTNTYILTADSAEATGLKWTAPAGGGDLVLVKSQTIGTSVSTVTVSDAFSSTYDAYKIIISGGSAASDSLLELTLGASTTTYYQAIAGVNYSSAGVTGRTVNNGSSWLRSGVESGSTGLYMDCTLVNPFLAKWTFFGANFPYSNEGSYSSGYHATATSYTAFTVTAGAAMTGGSIRVYGYKV